MLHGSSRFCPRSKKKEGRLLHYTRHMRTDDAEETTDGKRGNHVAFRGPFRRTPNRDGPALRCIAAMLPCHAMPCIAFIHSMLPCRCPHHHHHLLHHHTALHRLTGQALDQSTQTPRPLAAAMQKSEHGHRRVRIRQTGSCRSLPFSAAMHQPPPARHRPRQIHGGTWPSCPPL